jgi:hypothetical protein
MPAPVSSNWSRHLCLLLLLALLLGACAVVAAGDKSSGSDKRAEKGSGLYDTLPQPMTVAECGRCHLRHFTDLREEGGAHRFACQDCHQTFHAYNPRRNNYDELMPDCGLCHTPPHGDQLQGCLDCHQNPHAPLLLPSSQVLGSFCKDCHQPVSGALLAAPSAHTDLACADCHSQQHRRSPACAECHQPHLKDQPESACRQCHPVHQPLRINMAVGDTATCGACHGEVYTRWSSTRSRHGQVTCSDCHTDHGYVPACTDCHSQPHEEKMLSKFPNCLTCHGDVHDMPVNR